MSAEAQNRHWIRAAAAWGPASVGRRTAARCRAQVHPTWVTGRWGLRTYPKHWFDGILMGFCGILMGFNGIWWYFMGFDGILWYFNGIWWYLMGFNGILMGLMGFNGIYIMGFYGILMEFNGIYIMGFYGILMGFNGIYDGYPLVNCYITTENHHV